MIIYYLIPDYPLNKDINAFTRAELESLSTEGEHCIKFTPKAFETAFNDEQISDLGYIRIFK